MKDYLTKKAYIKHLAIVWSGLKPEERDVIGQSKCGPENCPKLAKIIPELIFTKMCKKHDLAYFIGGPLYLRKYADNIFYANMLKAIKKETKWSRWFYYGMAWVYYKAVSRYAKKSWSEREKPLTTFEVKKEVAKYVQRSASA